MDFLLAEKPYASISLNTSNLTHIVATIVPILNFVKKKHKKINDNSLLPGSAGLIKAGSGAYALRQLFGKRGPEYSRADRCKYYHPAGCFGDIIEFREIDGY